MLGISDLSRLTDMAESQSGNQGVYFVPALSGLGAPYWDSQARGLFCGLTDATTPAVLARAALESVAYQIADVFFAMENAAHHRLERLRVDGGATSNRWLMQFQADLLQRTLIRNHTAEVSALGAAYLGRKTLGWWQDSQQLAALPVKWNTSNRAFTVRRCKITIASGNGHRACAFSAEITHTRSKHMSAIPRKLIFAVIIGNRGFFPSYLVSDARRDAQALFDRLGINIIMLNEEQTPLGGVENWHDAKVCAELFRQHSEEIHGVVVILPNFGDEKSVSDAIRLSGLKVPVLVQAEEDALDKMGLATRRDSFCGKISLCNNLRQYGIPFTLTKQHVCSLNSEIFSRDVEQFVQLCRVVHAMKRVRVGAIGARPTNFNTVRYSEKLLENLGITVETLDLSEVFFRVANLSDNDIRVGENWHY